MNIASFCNKTMISLGNKVTSIINGTTYNGSDISIINGKVMIDGKEQDQSLIGPINITINGNCESVEVSCGDVTINGHIAGSVSSTTGDIECEGVGGNVSTSTGDIKCGNVAGFVKTVTGDIKRK